MPGAAATMAVEVSYGLPPSLLPRVIQPRGASEFRVNRILCRSTGFSSSRGRYTCIPSLSLQARMPASVLLREKKVSLKGSACHVYVCVRRSDVEG